MRKSLKAFVVFWLAFGETVMWVSTSSAADTHVIQSTPQFTWTYNGQSSKPNGTPLIVDDLKIGDVVEFSNRRSSPARSYYHQTGRQSASRRQRNQGPRISLR